MKHFLKNTLLTIAYCLGIPTIIHKRQKDVLTVLLYHGVAPSVESGIFNYRKKFISPVQFEKHIAYLKKHYTLLKLDDAVQALQNNTPLPPYPLVITFDDGYKNNLEYAVPILQKHNAPATIFVVTNFIDKKIPLWVDRLEYVIGNGTQYTNKTYKEKTIIDDTLRNELKKISTVEREARLQYIESENGISLTTADTDLYAPATWEEIRELNNSNISFGAHTQNHPILTNLPREEARREIAHSIHMLAQHVHTPSKVFAYPNGQPNDFNDTIKNDVHECGCIGALTTISGINTNGTDAYALKRYTMDGTDSMISFTIKCTGTLDWLHKLYKA